MLSNNLFIIANLLYNSNYAENYARFLDKSQFLDEAGLPNETDQAVFQSFKTLYEKHEAVPQLDTVARDCLASRSASEREEIEAVISELRQPFVPESESYTKETTQNFVKTGNYRATANKLEELSGQGVDDPADYEKYLDKLEAAREFSLNELKPFTIDDVDEYIQFVANLDKNKLPFRLDYFNRLTDGGLEPSTLNVIVAGAGVGKTAMMISLMADHIRDGKRVLYICAEEGDKDIALKLFGNLTGRDRYDLKTADAYRNRKMMEQIKRKYGNPFEILKLPLAANSTSQFATYLKRREKFDIIYLDYLNLFEPTKKTEDSLYRRVEQVTLEVKAVADKFEIPIVTATQFNRAGSKNEEADASHISQSKRVEELADLLLLIIETNDLTKDGRLLIKVEKNRKAGKRITKFLVDYDKDHNRISDTSHEGQDWIRETYGRIALGEKTPEELERDEERKRASAALDFDADFGPDEPGKIPEIINNKDREYEEVSEPQTEIEETDLPTVLEETKKTGLFAGIANMVRVPGRTKRSTYYLTNNGEKI